MRFGSVCSGIEAASVAWDVLGWRAAWLSEIEPFPCALLSQHYPDVPNLGDMTTIAPRILAGEVEAPDVFTGGTPCQAFSTAGKRQSLADERGNLTLTFCEIANAIDTVRAANGQQPAVIIWENVPGVLSTRDNAFGCFLGELAGESGPLEPAGRRWTDAGCVYGPARAVAWRVFDAQYFGLAQRRRRVFVVASARNGFDPAKVLFEFEGVRRDTPPRREAGEASAGAAAPRAGGAGALIAHCADVSPTLCRNSYSPTKCLEGDEADWTVAVMPFDTTQITSPSNRSNPQWGDPCHPLAAQAHPPAIAATGDVAHALRGEGFDASEDGTGRGTPIVATHGFMWQCGVGDVGTPDLCPTLVKNQTPAAAITPPLIVRRLTPRECERLQGFPDDYTAINWRGKDAGECPDSPRYHALGNSWAVPVARWVGARVAAHLARIAANDNTPAAEATAA